MFTAEALRRRVFEFTTETRRHGENREAKSQRLGASAVNILFLPAREPR
jgi:hypothetical protein